MPTKFVGMAFLALVLYPGSKNHHGPAEERTGQAYNKERDNEGYLAHVRSYPVLAPPRWIFFADLVQIASFVIVIELAQR